MNDEANLSKPDEREFAPGQANTDIGNFPDRQMEAQPGVFEGGREERRGGADTGGEDLLQYGDSRPDRLEGGGFDDITEDPRMTTMRDGHDVPEPRKEDPQFLAQHRVDQEDEIVPRPAGPEFDDEIAVLRPRVSKKGAESEGI